MSKKLVVIGAGESGTGAALLAKQKGFDVLVSDRGKIRDLYRDELDAAGIEWESGSHDSGRLAGAGIWILSPGIPPDLPMIQEARESGIEVIGEIEFAARYTNATLIGITGTNGKTTTTLLTHHLLKGAGLDVGLAGNVGKSFARVLAAGDHDYFVLELSSFQLDTMYRTRIHHAILLNITPDHLDRYGTMEAYTDSKFRILQNQTENDSFIYCLDDAGIRAGLVKHQPRSGMIPFSLTEKHIPGAWADEKAFHVQLDPTKAIFDMNYDQLTIGGKHNTYNSMAAAIVANSLLIRSEVIRESLMDFKNVEHRLEPVAKVKGMQFINDSKATNVNSAWYALESMDPPVIWIAGGVDKGNDYEMLEKLVADKVRILICLGKNNIKLHQAFAKHVDLIINTTSIDEAVKMAYNLGNPGETVLLSPACASFDLFENYEDRGRQFKHAVKNL
ncbi:MAG: UDP-N-acetylmuramoyl-L-alanine--D-glutamate ligase [Flavobacteriales bacterium]|nr:UDP-N-acetylmuramoyl-L-alanine--D-glutamate ligase [Flavobacteriales bacterium]